MKRTAPLAWILSAQIGLFASFACGQNSGQPPAVPQPAASAEQQPASSAVGADYVIGPGDTIQVFVWRHPELTTTVPVRPDGKVSTPLVEDIVAVGKRPADLSKDVERVLAEYVRSPQVNVIVTNAVGVLGQVQIIGQVTNPHSIPYRQGIKVLDVVLAAGGLSQYAAGNRAKIVRTQDGKREEIRVRLGDLVNKGAMQNNLELKPGDVIVVPQSLF